MIVWIASYPRSGNTFLRIILRDVFEIETYSIYDETEETCPVVSSSSGQAGDDHDPSVGRAFDWKSHAERRELDLVKTHHPPFDSGRAIYLIRDGRQSIASYYHYLRDIAHEDVSLVDVIAGFANFGSWGDHARAWSPRSRPETMLIRFEELVADPVSHLPRLAEFLGVQPRNGRIPTFEDLHRIAPKFFRSGRTDSWESLFSPDDLALIEALHGDVFAEYDYPLKTPPNRQPSAMLRELVRRADEQRRQLQALAEWQGEELRVHQMILAEAAETTKRLQERLSCRRSAA